MKILGIVLLVLGLVMASFTGFDLVTKKKVVDIGSLEISADEKTPIYWSPITGVILAVAGVALIVIYKDK
jgi:drug/metabolite transporter (DMT)-like permease